MFKISVDLESILSLENIDKTVKKIIAEANEEASQTLYKHIMDEAEEKLHSRKEKFIKAVLLHQEGDAYLIKLERSAEWIERGMDETDMIPFFMKSPKAKTSEKGEKYLVIPFDFSGSKKKQANTQAKSDLISTIKGELRKRKLTYSKIERHENGEPKLGKLHSFSIRTDPVKTHNGPGQGHGPIGAVRQGPSGRSFLDKVHIYQKKTEKGAVKRSVVTFRTALDSHSGKLWMHPGVEPANIFRDSADWFLKELDSTILPNLLERIEKSV